MALDTQHPSALPFIVGQVAFFAMANAPTGFLKANGAAVSRTTYAALFAAIGTRFGAGDGTTTFNLPDLRGEFIRGFDDGKGTDSGRTLGSAQGGMSQVPNGVLYRVGSFGYTDGQYDHNGVSTTANVEDFNAMHSADGNVNGVYPETRPRNVALLACIFTGV